MVATLRKSVLHLVDRLGQEVRLGQANNAPIVLIFPANTSHVRVLGSLQYSFSDNVNRPNNLPRLLVEAVDPATGAVTATLLDIDLNVQSYEYDFPGGLHNKVRNEEMRVTLSASGSAGVIGKLNAQAHFLQDVS